MCRDIRDDIDLYALGALAPADAEQVRLHVATCGVCRTAYHLAEDVVSAIARSAPRVAAPAELRASVMAIVGAAQPADAPPETRRPALARFAGRTRRWAARYGAAAAALLLAPLVGLLLWNARLQHEINTLRHDTAQMQRRNEGLLLLAIPSSAKADFQAVGEVKGAVGAATWHPERGVCIVLFDGLQKPESGSAYRLWYTVDGQRIIDAGEVLPDDTGKAEAVIAATRWRGHDYDLTLRLEQAKGDPNAPALLIARLRRPQ